MNIHRIVNLIMVILFCIVLVIPTIYVSKTSDNISYIENRKLANFPEVFTQNNRINSNFKLEFETWFNDNLGFRGKMVSINTQAQFGLFNKLTRTDVVVGKENWLYLMYPHMLDAYHNDYNLSENDLDTYKQTLLELESYLNNKGIPLITAIYPNKETIYPEYMPDSIIKKNESSKIDQVSDYLIKNTNLNLVYPKDKLIQEKENKVVYSQNYDLSHWNQSGAFIGYTELMKKIKEYITDLYILQSDQFTIEQYTRKREDISVSEVDYNWIFNKGYSSIEERGALDAFVFENNINYRYVNQKENSLPKLLVLGDSFVYMFMLQNLAESFSEVTFIHSNNIENLKNYVDVFEPDVFVLEFWELALHDFVNTINIENMINPCDEYKDLPIFEHSRNGVFWIDYSNNELNASNLQLNVDTGAPITIIKGWAIDPINNQTAENVFLKIDNEFYSGEYGLSMPSVAEFFENENLLNSGYIFSIATNKLINANNVSIVVISHDKSQQLAPISLEVVYN